MIHEDGHPMSYGSLAIQMTGRYGSYSLVSMIEGVVLKAYYPDDEKSITKKVMEYDVLIVATKTILPHVRQLLQMGGFADGDVLVLRETTGLADKAQADDPAWVNKNIATVKMNGDRVLVGFINGSQDSPMIMGVVPHPATAYGGTRSLGRQRVVTHQGTTATIDKDGNASVVFPDGKKCVVSSKNVSITLDDDGKKVQITASNNGVVEINGNKYSLLQTEDLLADLAQCLRDLNTGLVAGTAAGGPLVNIVDITKALVTLALKLSPPPGVSSAYLSTAGKHG